MSKCVERYEACKQAYWPTYDSIRLVHGLHERWRFQNFDIVNFTSKRAPALLPRNGLLILYRPAGLFCTLVLDNVLQSFLPTEAHYRPRENKLLQTVLCREWVIIHLIAIWVSFRPFAFSDGMLQLVSWSCNCSRPVSTNCLAWLPRLYPNLWIWECQDKLITAQNSQGQDQRARSGAWSGIFRSHRR